MDSWTTSGGQTICQILKGRCNSFLVSHKDRYLLVDPGTRLQWKSLTKRLDALGIGENAATTMVLTHSHFDHAENAAAVKKRYKAPIIIHRTEVEYLQRGDNPVIRGSVPITRFVTDVLLTRQLLRLMGYQPAQADILVDERYDLNPFGFNAYLLHTPGHTPGSMSVIIEDEIAMVGDTMVGTFKGSMFPLYAEDPRQMVRSWQTLLDTGCSMYLPAHGTGRSRKLLQQKVAEYRRAYDL